MFDLQDNNELAYEVKKFKCMYNKAYNQQIIFLFSENVF